MGIKFSTEFQRGTRPSQQREYTNCSTLTKYGGRGGSIKVVRIGAGLVVQPLSSHVLLRLARGLPVRIPGVDMALLGKPCCGRRPTHKVEEDRRGC